MPRLALASLLFFIFTTACGRQSGTFAPHVPDDSATGGVGGTTTGDGGSGGEGGTGGSSACVVPNLGDLQSTDALSISGRNFDRLSALDVDGNGRVILGGSDSSGADLGGGPTQADGPYDAFVAAVSGSTVDWVHSYATPDQDQVLAVAAAPGGDVFASVVTGIFSDRATASLERLDSKTGKAVWHQADSPQAMAVDAAGNLVGFALCNQDVTVQNSPFCLTKREGSTGNLLWPTRTFGGDSYDGRGTLALDAQGNALVSGEIAALKGPVDFGDGAPVASPIDFAFLASFDGNSGAIRWKRVFLPPAGDTGVVAITSLAADGAGGVVIAGYYFNAVDLGGTTLRAPGVQAGFLARFHADSGALDWSRQIAYPDHGTFLDVVGSTGFLAVSYIGPLTWAGKTLGGEAYNVALMSFPVGTGDLGDARLAASGNRLRVRALRARCDGTLRLVADYDHDLQLDGGTLQSAGADDAALIQLSGP